MSLVLPFCIDAQDREDPCPLSENKKARKYYNSALDVVKSNKNEAKELLLKALEIDPDFGWANFVMGDILIKSKKVKEAEPFLLKAVINCPDLDPSIYLRLGSIQFGDKRFEAAKVNLGKFLETKSGKEKEQSEAREMLTACIFFIEGFAKPVPFNPKPLAAICTEADEYLPVITADNEKAYFTRRTFVKEVGAAVTTKPVERFSFSGSLSENDFTKGEQMPPPFNKSLNEGGASLSADNKFMFFTVCKNDGEGMNCDIWYTFFSKGQWAEIKNAGPLVNGKKSWDSQPSLSSDGKTLYFASTREGGFGELDIWKCIKDKDNTWSAPINLGPEINTKGNEKSPFFHSDGQTLYFSSTGQLGYGGYDIFFSKLDKEDKWAVPKNIGYPINSEKDDLGFFVSTDGRSGYFASDKLKGVGGWDIYFFDLYKEARPERVVFVSGEVRNEKNEVVADAKVELKNTRTKEVTQIDVDSLTGKYVAVVAFNEDHILTIKEPGKAFTSQYLSTADSSLNKPKKLDLKVEEIKVGKTYQINNINFSTNSYLLTPETINIVEELSIFLAENPAVKISIQGHTDNVGKPEENLKLSKDRAKMVLDLLVLNGIDSARLTHKGFGATKPVASNMTEKGKALNRRTEFVITGK